MKNPDPDAELAGDEMAEVAAIELAEEILSTIDNSAHGKGAYITLSAIENVLCLLLLKNAEEEEHFAMMASLMHNVALKLYAALETDGDDNG